MAAVKPAEAAAALPPSQDPAPAAAHANAAVKPRWPLLETRIPAPVAATLAAAGMWLYARWAHLTTDGPAWRVAVAVAMAQASALIALVAFATFWRAHTTINPFQPQRAARLVTHGIFRVSRNPMYLSLALLLAGYAVRLGSVAALAGPAAFVCYMTRFQIVPEERVLSAKFGDAYRAYIRQTRRWI